MIKNFDRSSVIEERIYKISHLPASRKRKDYWENMLGKKTMYKLYENPGIVNHLNNKDFYICSNIFDKINPLLTIFEENLFSDEELIYDEADDDFALFYQYFLKLAQYYIKRNTTDDLYFMNNNVIRDYLKTLLKKLKTISLRTLIHEIHFLKEEGYLKGDNSKEEYKYYERNYLTDFNYIYEVCKNYPVILRCILETIVSFSDFITSVLKSLHKDKKDIVEMIFHRIDFNQILSFHADIADTHLNCNTVIKFDLDNKKSVIYKPHSIKNEICYQNLVNWLYQGCRIPEFTRRILDRENYGWEELILQKSCKSEQELKNYYTRIGVNLFLTYLLNTGDIHYENIIAYGEFPVIIDLETLIGIGAQAHDTAKGHISKILGDSVLYLGLLPSLNWGTSGNGVNLSGINGKKGQKLPFKIPYVKNNKSSEITIEYGYPKTNGGRNLAKLNDRYMESDLFTQDLILGFNLAYLYSVENNETLKEIIKDLQNTKSRFLLRDTQHYSSLLMASYHPDFMMDGSDRNILLYQLIETCKFDANDREKIVEAEVKELIKGDIPLFFVDIDSKYLILSDGTRLENFFSTTAYNNVCEKIHKLCDEDLERQNLFIKLTMETKKVSEGLQQGPGPLEFLKADKEQVFQAVEKIGDRLVEQAVFNSGFTDVNWIGIFKDGTNENGKIFRSLDYFLYDGIAGVAIFMNALNTIIPKSSYTRLCEIIDKTLFAYTDSTFDNAEGIKEEGVGAFSGEASIVYTYQVLYNITGNLKYLNYAKTHSKILPTLIEKDKKFDLLNGNAGVIIVLLNLYTLTQKEEYIRMAKKAADLLIEKAVNMPNGLGWKLNSCDVPLGGLSHGNSGIGLAFALLSKTANTKEYNHIIDKLLNYEDSLYDYKCNNWADLRDGKKIESLVSWCHGSSGILLSRMIVRNALSGEFDERLDRDMDRAAKKILGSNVLNGNCLCHGNCGNINILNTYAKYSGDKKIPLLYSSFLAKLASKILNSKSEILLSEYSHPGFMTGISGIGYCLLGYLSKKVPDVLSLSLISTIDEKSDN